MTTKVFLIFFLIWSICCVAFGWFFYKNTHDTKLEINYGDVIVRSIDTVLIQRSYTLLELPKKTVDIVQIYTDKEDNEHYVYVDTMSIQKEDMFLSMNTKVDVNVSAKKAEFIYSNIEVNCPERTITIEKEVPKLVTEYKPVPFYRDHWFYSTIATITLLVTTIIYGGS